MDRLESQPPDAEPDWTLNYFNYFTEIEEHFQRARGTGLFLLSPLDWALVENWKAAGVPLEAVLRGIDDAFEKWRARKRRRNLVNSLAYCSQAVMDAANKTPSRKRPSPASDANVFAVDELQSYLAKALEQIRSKPEQPFREIVASLESLIENLAGHANDLEVLEQRLTALEDKMVAAQRASQSEEKLFEMRQALNSELRPYRGKMTADQIATLERRYLDSALLETANLPRLSLFYIR